MKKKRPRFWFKALITILILVAGIVGGAFAFFRAYPGIFKTTVAAAKNQNIQPAEAVYIDFSAPVRAEDYNNKIRIIPREKAKFSWTDGNKRLAITPQKLWKPETSYRITLPEGRNAALIKIPASAVKFSTIEYPKVIDFFPKNQEKDVVLDIEDPIVIDFDKPTKDFSLKFSISPESEMGYESNEDKTQFKLIPKQKAETEKNQGKKYEIEVYVKHAKDKSNDYKKIHQSTFETLLPPPPNVWEKDFTLRLAQARRLTRPQISEGKYIDINLETQILSTFENGRLIDSYLISSGKKGMYTPTGKFKVQNKHPRAWSRTYGLYMPYWMAFVPGGKYGIHELPEWPGGYKEGTNHLGIPVSHGCVRLGVGPAKAVYEWVEVGTSVVIY